MPAGHPGWGGKRANSGGRKPGSKNRFRKTERLSGIVREIESADYLTTNTLKEFAGSAHDFLKSVMKAEQLPLRLRIYCAKELLVYEPRPAKNELRSECGLEDAENRSWITAQLDRLVAAEGPAATSESDPACDTVERHARDMPEIPKQIQYVAPYHTDAHSAQHERVKVAPDPPEPSPPPPAEPSPWELPSSDGSKRGLVVLHAPRPFAEFWIGGTGRITADGNAEILVEEGKADTIDALIRSGCRLRR
jgi:hypothetical protein